MMHGPVVAQSMTNGETIMASAEIVAPPERVFHALITDEVERWWGSCESYRMVDWTADLRVGDDERDRRDAAHVRTGGRIVRVDRVEQ